MASTTDDWVNNSGRRRKLYKQFGIGKKSQVKCWICSQPGADSLDHIKSRHKHPELTWEIANLQPAHITCNSSKGAGEGKPGLGVPSEVW